MKRLSRRAKDQVTIYPSKNIFRFGKNLIKKSLGWYNIPCSFNGRNIIHQVDRIDLDNPCIISKEAMRQAGVKMDLPKDEITIYGETIKVGESSSGHYILRI